ncbi:MAG: VWA domain-containing protein [Chlorobi bacterium]|nr:VWA domain-containing protein [Chlorobiota bacterium]
MFNYDEWANPEYLWALLLIPALIAWYLLRNKKRDPELVFSDNQVFADMPLSPKIYLVHLLFVIRLFVIALLIVALARPQSVSSKQNINIEGIDIVTALDVSSSMLARDLQPNRLEAAKAVSKDFISKRPNDRVGLVIFSGEAFTQVPLTTDHQMIYSLFREIESGMIEDGTAIGDGLATSVSRLKDSQAISKVIILLTDGVNNAGSIDPRSAAELAKMYGIRVYTIGVGTQGYAPYPMQTPFGVQMQNVEVQIDEDLLKEIAKTTGGRYFRAQDNKSLKAIYDEIDKLEKSKIDVQEFKRKHEKFMGFALWALGLFVLEVVLRFMVFRKFP